MIVLPGGLATAGIAYDFPGVVAFQLLAVSFAVTASGGGGARQVVAQLQDSTGAAVFGVAAPGTQASGQTVVYSFSGTTPPFGSGALGFMGSGFLDAKIAENLSLVVSVVSAGAPDTIFDARALVRQWPRDVGYPAIGEQAA